MIEIKNLRLAMFPQNDKKTDRSLDRRKKGLANQYDYYMESGVKGCPAETNWQEKDQ